MTSRPVMDPFEFRNRADFAKQILTSLTMRKTGRYCDKCREAIFSPARTGRRLPVLLPWPYPPDGAYTHYRDAALPAMERGDAWHWTLRLKTEPERLIGSINLRKGEDTNRGFWLGLTWQRQGLMTEACETVTEFWFNTLKFPVLRVTKAVANIASSRISEKSGMRIGGLN